MSGETNLKRLLAGLEPVLDSVPFGFVVVPHGQRLPDQLLPFGLLRETEGLTVIAVYDELVAAGIPVQAQWARITMTVHSALEAVGMTAAMAAALTEIDISANVVAAYHHDHVFVPWARRDEAVTALRALAKSAGH